MDVSDSAAKSPETSNYRHIIEIVVITALALGFLSYAIRPTPATQPTTSQRSSPTISMTAHECSTSASLPCGFTNGTQGSIVITNASLTVSASASLNSSVVGYLSLTLVHTGDFEGDPLSFYLCQPDKPGCGEVLQSTAAGQNGIYTTPIYAPIALTHGVKYEVDVDSLYHTSTYPGEGAIEEIEILKIAVVAN